MKKVLPSVCKLVLILVIVFMPFRKAGAQTIYVSTSGSYYSWNAVFSFWQQVWGGQVYSVNLATCTATVVLPFSIGSPTPAFYDIAACPSNPNILYAIDGNNNVYLINLTIPSYTLINSSFPGIFGAGHQLNSLVCDASCNLYTADANAGGLYYYNTGTNTWSFVGNPGYLSGGDLTYYNGNLFLTTTSNQLVSITTSPFSATLVSNLNQGNMFGVVAVSSGGPCLSNVTMIGSADSSLYTVNPVTGICTPLCPNLISGGYQVIYGSASPTEANNPVPVPVTASASTPNLCAGGGGTSTLTAGGAVSYVWNPGAIPGSPIIVSPGATTTYTVTGTDGSGCTGKATVTVTVSPPPPVAVSATSPIICSGGSTTLNATGATTYSWDPGALAGASVTVNPGATTTYTVTGTTAGCSASATVTITVTIVTATNSQTNLICNGASTGTATVNPAGGTGPYTYSWAPAGSIGGGQGTATATGLVAGSYICTITDATGCSTTSGVTITQPSAINISTTSAPALCGSADGSATVTSVTGGTGAYTYSWTPAGAIGAGQGTTAATALAAGTYTITVTDNNGCAVPATVAVSNSGGPTAVISSSTNVLCNGASTGSATVTSAGGAAPYTYSWNSTPSQATATASGLPAGTYNVTVTDHGGCQTTTSVTITEPAAITSANTQVNILCTDASSGSATVNPSGGTGVYTFSWTSTAAIGGGQGTVTATGLSAGTYTCTITDHNGCSAVYLFTLTQPPALTISSSQTNIMCNGVNNGTASVTPGGGTGAYTYSWTPAGAIGWGQGTANVNALAAGNYTCTLTDNNGCTTSTSLTITQPPPFTVTNTASNVTCNGAANGSITVNPVGGTTPYTYVWSPSGGNTATASPLGPGTYTCNLTDANGCTASSSATITEPTVLSSSTTQINESCNGGLSGSATVTAVGGTTPYTYSWSPTGGTSSTSTASGAGTYTCTTTDASGCVTTNVVTITEPPAITITSTQVNELCNGNATGSATVTASGGTGALTYSWTPSGGGGTTASSLTAGTYTCVVNDATGCNNAAILTITQPAVLALTTSNTPATCGAPNGTATVTASGGTGAFTYSWTPSGGNGVTASGLATGTYTATVNDANNCIQTATAVVAASGGPTVTISSTNITCNGASNGTATVNATAGVAPLTYSWSPTAGATTVINGLGQGTYTCVITDANGCGVTLSVAVAEPAPLVLNIPSSTNVTCNGGNNGSATSTASGGTGALTYSWTPSGGTAPVASGLTAGLYTISVTDANGCSQTQTVTISEPPALTISMAGITTKCFGSCDGVLICIPAGGTTPYSYSWNTGCTTPSCNNTCIGTYSVTVTDLNGCTVSGTTTVAQPTPIVLTMFAQPAHCMLPDGTDSVSATGGSPAVGGYTYSWSPGAGSASSADHNVTPGLYVVTVTDANGCQMKDSLSVGNTPGVAATIVSTKNTSCFGGNNGWAVAGGAGGNLPYTYLWTAPAISAQDSALNLSAGTYTVTVTDGRGCTSKDTAIIFQPNPVVSTPMAALTLCIGQCVPLTATGSGGTPGYTFTWTQAGIAAASPACPVTTTTYTVSATDANGCVSVPAPVTVTVRPPLQIVAGGDSAICPGGIVQLHATASGGDGNFSYSWSTALGLNSTTISNPTADPAFTTIYTVVLKDGCGTPVATATDTVTIYPIPAVVFSANDTAGCVQLCVNFTSISNPACANAIWNFGDGTIVNGCNTSTHCYTQPGVFTVSENITDIHGCKNSFTQTNYIDAWPTPEAAFTLGPQPTTIVNSEIYFSDHSSGATTWNWNFGDFAGSTSTLQNPKYTYPDTGCFTSVLIVTNSFGCKDTATGALCIHPDFSFYAPNAFTPNGDGKNDLWRPMGLGIDPTTYHMMMFDRWGNLMWETRLWDEGWDGKANGGERIAQIDTYVWRCSLFDFLGNPYTFTGVCNLIK